MKKIDQRVGQKFALAAAILMTREFSTPLRANQRRLSFASGVATADEAVATPTPDLKFDVVGLGFRPGREWQGPSNVFVEEMRDGEQLIWTNCQLYASTNTGPIYVLTEDPEVCFSFDGDSLVRFFDEINDKPEGLLRAKALLRETARRLPNDLKGQQMQ